MSTRTNTNNSRTGAQSGTAKRNYTAIDYGNDHGSASFGKVHKKGDVTSSVLLQGKDGRHRFYMDADGQRPGYTTLTSPGTTRIRSGMDLDAEQDGIVLIADNGDIDIIASNGKIRMVADDIELVAVGSLEQGNIKLNASESILLDSKKINDLGWKPKISFKELVFEMVDQDLELSKRDQLIKNKGFKSKSFYE